MIFGERAENAQYRRRPGAYAVIFDEHGRFAAVQGLTKLFLPGGGIEANESLEETLVREVREECACEILIGQFLGSGIQYFTGEDGAQWEFHCSYFQARFGAELDNEPEHELHWLELAEAHKLAHEIHVWAVCQLAQRNGAGQK